MGEGERAAGVAAVAGIRPRICPPYAMVLAAILLACVHGSPRMAFEVLLAGTVYLSLAVLLRPLMRRRAPVLRLAIDIVGMTAALLILGELTGPLVGIYAVLVAGAALSRGRRPAIAAGLISLAVYVGVLCLIAAGLLPDRFVPPASVGQAITAGSIRLLVLLLYTGNVLDMGIRLGMARVRGAERRYRAVFETSGDPIVVVEPVSGRVLAANPAAVAASGWSREKLLATTVWDIKMKPSREELDEVFRRRALPGGPVEAQHSYERPDGTVRDFQTTLAEVELEGRPVVVAIARDVTDRRALEETRVRHAQDLEREVARRTEDLLRANATLREVQGRLVRAERLAAEQELAAGVAHAINNPLAVLIGTVQMRLDGATEPDPADERILHLGRRIGRVIDGMLTLSRRGVVQPVRISSLALLEDVAEELHRSAVERGARIAVQVGPDLPDLFVDRSLLTTALVCLTENGLQAGALDGAEPVVELEAGTSAGGRVVELCVTDRGPGIPPELVERVFEPFFSTRPSGNGLGLTIARAIVTGHRGRIAMEPGPDGGTRVRVEIPVRPGSPDKPDADQAAADELPRALR